MRRHLLIAVLLVGRLAAAEVTRIEHEGAEAYRLSNGKTEAVIVPSLARVMRYGYVGGSNWIWTAAPGAEPMGGWINHGGDKTWIGPQLRWPELLGSAWPPPPALESGHRAEVRGDRLRTESPVIEKCGVRVVREFFFEKNGDFAIAQTVENVSGAPVTLAIWSVTQTPLADAWFVPLNPASPYKNNFLKMSGAAPKTAIHIVSPTLLRLQAPAGHGFKIGADAPVSAIAAVKDGVAFIQRAPHPDGEYPDGAPGHGFPVEFYCDAVTPSPYAELELLSPIYEFAPGSSRTHTVRWSLHALPTRDVADRRSIRRVEELLTERAE